MKRLRDINAQGRAGLRQGGFLISSVLALWALCCAFYLPRVIGVGVASHSALGLLVASVLGLFFMLFWLYGAYHLVVFAVNRLIGRREKEKQSDVLKVVDGGEQPAVAILYPTMNDFDETAIRSCMNQDYTNFHIFILDDSTDTDIRAEIDCFYTEHVGKLTLVRRTENRGYKAGNLNHALAEAARDYPLFAILDADCVLPPDFVSRLVPQLFADPEVAFIQAANRARDDETRLLARIMAPAVEVLWGNYMPYRDRYGFTPFMGHGALLKREAWEDVGGFPEVVAEDVAFTLAVRERGLHGKYVSDPVCYEALPPTYRSFCGQQARYSRGACQLLCLYWRRLLFSKKLSWFEKIDLGLLIVSNVLPGVLFLFMLLIAFIIPAVFYDVRLAHLSVSNLNLPFLIVFTPGPELSQILTRDFYALSVVCILAPILGTLGVKGIRWRDRIRFLSWSTALHLALLPQSFLETLRFVKTRKSEFFVTGNRVASSDDAAKSGRQKAVERLNLASVVIFLACSVVTLNLYLAAVGVAILVGMLMKSSRREQNHSRRLGLIASLPSVLITLAVSLLGFGLVAAQGAAFALMPFHF